MSLSMAVRSRAAMACRRFSRTASSFSMSTMSASASATTGCSSAGVISLAAWTADMRVGLDRLLMAVVSMVTSLRSAASRMRRAWALRKTGRWCPPFGSSFIWSRAATSCSSDRASTAAATSCRVARHRFTLAWQFQRRAVAWTRMAWCTKACSRSTSSSVDCLFLRKTLDFPMANWPSLSFSLAVMAATKDSRSVALGSTTLYRLKNSSLSRRTGKPSLRMRQTSRRPEYRS
mmetsp:Transcript_3305/g.9600  ORF Transcript_3305/g.9600 Transcript_3305/m.9600 type:complete len:233 (+) Transcript_3305:3951-4649(+)